MDNRDRNYVDALDRIMKEYQMETKDESLKLFAVIFNILLVVGAMFYVPFVLMKMYNWFIPGLTGWNNAPYWVAFGINLILSIIQSKSLSIKTIKDDEKFNVYDRCKYMTSWLIAVSIFFGIGTLAHLWI